MVPYYIEILPDGQRNIINDQKTIQELEQLPIKSVDFNIKTNLSDDLDLEFQNLNNPDFSNYSEALNNRKFIKLNVSNQLNIDLDEKIEKLDDETLNELNIDLNEYDSALNLDLQEKNNDLDIDLKEKSENSPQVKFHVQELSSYFQHNANSENIRTATAVAVTSKLAGLLRTGLEYVIPYIIPTIVKLIVTPGKALKNMVIYLDDWAKSNQIKKMTSLLDDINLHTDQINTLDNIKSLDDLEKSTSPLLKPYQDKLKEMTPSDNKETLLQDIQKHKDIIIKNRDTLYQTMQENITPKIQTIVQRYNDTLLNSNEKLYEKGSIRELVAKYEAVQKSLGTQKTTNLSNY